MPGGIFCRVKRTDLFFENQEINEKINGIKDRR
jgi:hypothetical protein